MEAKEPIMNLGRSLPVPCVQELAKENLTIVPARYVRPDQDPPMIRDTGSLPQVPVIDLHKLLAGDDELVVKSELEKFHVACKDWGFFQLINHGVRSDVAEKVKQEIEGFFKLSTEEKKKWSQKPGEIEGFGQAFVVSEEQKLDWADMFYMTTLPVHLRKPYLFPKLPLSLRSLKCLNLRGSSGEGWDGIPTDFPISEEKTRGSWKTSSSIRSGSCTRGGGGICSYGGGGSGGGGGRIGVGDDNRGI